MAAKISRRRLAALSTVPLLPQAGASQQTAPQDDLTIQRENLRRWREQMAKKNLPMATEPAFQFKA